jgi:hypothetical protein
MAIIFTNGFRVGELDIVFPTGVPQPTATPTPNPTPTPTASGIISPTPTPTDEGVVITPTPTPTATEIITTPTPTPTEVTPTPTPTETSGPTPTPTEEPAQPIFPINISLQGNYGVPTSSTIRYTAAFFTTSSGTKTLSAGPDVSCNAGCTSTGVINDAQLGDSAFISISKIDPDQIATDQVSLTLDLTGSGNVVGVNPIIISVGNSVINEGWSVTGIDETTELSVVIFEG